METAATHSVPVVQVPVTPASAIRRLRWAWPVAILIGFPIGGYAANMIVGKIDSVGAALIGGLIAGAILGAAQWLALRSFVPWVWLVATSVGMAAGLTAGAALVGYGVSRGDLALMGAVTGLVVGGLQAFLLARRGSGALWWVAVNPTWPALTLFRRDERRPRRGNRLSGCTRSHQTALWHRHAPRTGAAVATVFWGPS
jgi:hypothetical protein